MATGKDKTDTTQAEADATPQQQAATSQSAPTRTTLAQGVKIPIGDLQLADLQAAFPGISSSERGLRRSELSPQAQQAVPLWAAINLHTDRIGFQSFQGFVNRVLVGGEPRGPNEPDFGAQLAQFRAAHRLPSVNAYQLLREAAEAFLVVKAGVWRTRRTADGQLRSDLPTSLWDESGNPLPPDSQVDADLIRLGSDVHGTTHKELRQRLQTYLGVRDNNYLETIVTALVPSDAAESSPYSGLYLDSSGPVLIELIWSYWMEEAMLAQAVNALLLRFQNIRRPGDSDPLAELEIDPLRPLSGFLWGYLQDEPNRLSVMRRAYEYNHQYGLTLYGRAVPQLRPADPRQKFLQAFHNLLRECARFYREDNDTTVIADAFGVLNALKEVHLILAEGAHNQFRELPWTARVEMLLQQWLLSRPEMREFLRGRAMVPYPEDWMARLDAMNKLQGWTDTSVLHFRDLAVYGERILLSVRYGNWTGTGDQDYARAWARYWRQEIQGYIHSYQAATGVGLADEVVGTQPAEMRYTQPSALLRRRREDLAALPRPR
jgi:hypothetical protein